MFLLFFVAVYSAVYVFGQLTFGRLSALYEFTQSVQPLNVYVYSAVFHFVGFECVGLLPYSTVVVSIVLQLSFFHVIV